METKQEESKKQVRKKRTQQGTTTQMVSFRLDLDLIPGLNSQGNKGRFINDSIRLNLKNKK